MTIYTEEQILMLEKGEINCEDFQTAMCDYADGDLPETIKARIDEHAASCEECDEFKRTYLLTISLAGELGQTQKVSAETTNRLRDALNERLGLKLKQLQAL